MTDRALKVGIVGYGHLGDQFLVEKIQKEGPEAGLQDSLPKELILHDLSDFTQTSVIVEVCHPLIVKEFGVRFLSHAHFLVGSPSALSDPKLEQDLRTAAKQYGKTLYVPSGALWGGQDIKKMNGSGTLRALSIRMSKHPSCFRLTGGLLSDWTEGEGRRVLYNGSVAELRPIAPNNVNTMAAAAIAASKLGFPEKSSQTLLSDYHIVEAEVTGPDGFTVKTVQQNPAKLGAVTGNATYNSFWSSLLGMCQCVYVCM
uniref:Aspartate dehydrogenase domain-containing protein n=1 Tax=Sinocyclocheilus anshuiensis TaxID=1608454 RepID=A0A671S9W6_9TELE